MTQTVSMNTAHKRTNVLRLDRHGMHETIESSETQQSKGDLGQEICLPLIMEPNSSETIHAQLNLFIG